MHVCKIYKLKIYVNIFCIEYQIYTNNIYYVYTILFSTCCLVYITLWPGFTDRA